MRPGPGLVVMALAFISGARRGSTSQQKISSSTSSSSSSSSPSSSSSFLFPSFLTGSTSSSASSSLSSLSSSSNNYHSSYDYTQYYSPLKSQLWKHIEPRRKVSEIFSYTSPPVPLPKSRTSKETKARKRRTLQGDEGGGGGGGKEEAKLHLISSLLSDSTSTSSFQYPVSNSDLIFEDDEDDVITEEELISEDSEGGDLPNLRLHFKHLNLGKIGYINEEDYRSDIRAVKSAISDRDISSSAGDITINKLISDSEAETDIDGDGQNLDFHSIGSKSPVFESSSSLTRINPWISACDLAQPSSAPDLQGQCTAGTLPVAWVDEGPGPPTCPKSCNQLKLETNANNRNNLNFNYLKYSHKLNNNNNHHNNNLNPSNNKFNMSKVRRDATTVRSTTPTTPVIITTKAATIPAMAGSLLDSTSMSASSTGYHQTRPSHRHDISPSESLVVDKVINYSTNNDNGNNNNNNKNINNNIAKNDANKNNYNNYNANNYNNNHDANTKSNLAQEYTDNIYNSNHNYNSNQPLQQQQQPQQQQQQQLQQQQKQQQQQQCLDYLGDNDESSPTQLCKIKSPSELANKLRTLRLKHCCERTVFSTLHTTALNTTLSGGQQCVSILTDIADLDSLATRITCELAEILFRYDCRQIYSLVHQCKDCKEAYRRWVCSTLIPYFAEQSTHTDSRNTNDPLTTTATRSATSFATSNSNSNQTESKQSDKHSLNTNDENYMRENNNNNNENIYNSNNNYKSKTTNNSPNDRRSSRSADATGIFSSVSPPSVPFSIYETADDSDDNDDSDDSINDPFNVDNKDTSRGHQPGLKRSVTGQCVEKSTFHRKGEAYENVPHNQFISTANSEDPCVEDPVISRLFKRTKRRAEFRKRRRIRPCLSVCQTVEQKCPYLLPGDRAPAYPTQYAGEPTFLCLDPNIPETGEQLRKSNHGPPECCYRYCNPPEKGICTYCDDFDGWQRRTAMAIALANRTNSKSTASSSETNVDNVTSDDLQSRIAGAITNSNPTSAVISLSNVIEITSVQDVERLRYYTRVEDTYYYDDIDEMPSEPIAECQPVPPATSRCTIPYYASAATATSSFSLSHYIVIYLWSIWYLVNNYYLILIETITMTGDNRNCCLQRRCPRSNRNRRRSSSTCKTPPTAMQSTSNKISRSSRREISLTNNSSNSSNKCSRRCNSHNNNNMSYCFFYHYNYNLNDWWKRWWLRPRSQHQQQQRHKIKRQQQTYFGL